MAGQKVALTGEKEVVTNTPTEADIAAFQNDGGRELDFQSFMEGTPAQQGGQHDMLSRGLTTDRGEFQQPPDTLEVHPLFPEQPRYVQQAAPQQVEQPQGQDFQRLYGQSENEKGELRRALKAQMDANSQLLTQVQQFMAQSVAPQPPQYSGYNGPSYPAPTYPTQAHTNGYSQVQPQVSYSQPPQLPQRFMPVQDGQVPMAEDVEAMVRNYIAPGMYDAYQTAQAARQEASELRQLLVAQAKQQAGITPQVETQALLERPWLRTLQNNPQAYLSALGDYQASRQAQAVYNRTAPVTPQATMPATAAAAARRVTYIEGAPQSGGTSDPGSQPSQFQQEMAQAMSQDDVTKRAIAMRQVMKRYGINQTNDYRDPSVVTR